MKKAVSYIRVSSKGQEDRFSLNAQKELIKDYAVKNNLEIVKEFTEIETAKKAGRKIFNEMFEFIRKNSSVEYILFEKTDRMARNFHDSYILDELIKELDKKDRKLTICLIKENRKIGVNSSPYEQMAHDFQVMMARNYILNLSAETKKGMDERAKQGLYPCRAPVGYKMIEQNSRKIMLLDEKQAPYIKQMFELYATGTYSLQSLRDEIIKQGYRTNNGLKPCKAQIEFILKNEIYTGVFYYKGKKHENALHPLIVDISTFRHVQAVMKNPTRTKSRKEIFTYANLLKCGVCGCALTAEIKKEKYIYYHCTGNKGGICKKDYVRQESIDESIEEMLKGIRLSDNKINFIIEELKKTFNDKKNFQEFSIKNLRKQVDVIRNRLHKIYLDKLDGKIDEAFWQELNHKLQKEKDELSYQLQNHEEADKNFLENANLIFELAKNASNLWLRQTDEEKRKMLNFLCSNFSYKGGELNIELNSPFAEMFDINRQKLPVNTDTSILLDDNILYLDKIKYPGQDSNL